MMKNKMKLIKNKMKKIQKKMKMMKMIQNKIMVATHLKIPKKVN